MENVTFVSNSHQRPAADNLQKLKSLLTNTQQQIKSQTQQVTIKNLYVSSFTLVCFRSGKLTISNNHVFSPHTLAYSCSMFLSASC